MASINNTNYGSNAYSRMFTSLTTSSSKSNNNTDLTMSLLSGAGTNFGDYSMIQSGAYKKLLTAYYAQNNVKKLDDDVKSEKTHLIDAKANASALNDSIKNVMKFDITEENRDNIKDSLKSFVDTYNKTIDSAAEVDNKSVLRNTLWMTRNISSNGGVLKDVGISIGKDNKLEFNEEKFTKADMSSMKTLFKGNASLMGRLSQKSEAIVKLANKAAGEDNHASAYTSFGEYNTITRSTMYDSIF